NYPEAIACLQKKYGDSDSRIEDLLADLQRCKAEKRDTNSMKDIQTRTLEKRADLENPKDWTWAKMQKELSGILQRREYVEQTRNKINAIQESPAERPMQPIRGNRLTCIYCKRFGHQSADCRTIKLSERLPFLTRNRLCINCAKPFHTANVCPNPPCKKCGRTHHISLCAAPSSPPNPQEGRRYATSSTRPVFQQQTRQPAQNKRSAPKTTKSTPITNQNVVVQERLNTTADSNDEKTEKRATGSVSRAKTLLLTGTAILLDKKEKVHTFHLYDSPILTAHVKEADLTREDLDVINRKRTPLSSKLDGVQCAPQILLGCDYLW
ncbi:zinc knuckle, partial [Ostertagia ostertagi]